ncbi:methyltransferase domain-containing protein [Myxococcaceae bacterium GXIMD 01537]
MSPDSTISEGRKTHGGPTVSDRGVRPWQGPCTGSPGSPAPPPGPAWTWQAGSPEQALERLRVADALHLAERITPHKADGHTLPFEAATFDGVLFIETVGATHVPDRLFAEVFRALKPSGTVYIEDLFQPSGPLSEEARRAQVEFDEQWAQEPSPTLPDTEAHLRRAGFADVRSSPLDDAEGPHFIGALFGRDGGEAPFQLSLLGRHLYGASPHLPSFFGEVSARKPR